MILPMLPLAGGTGLLPHAGGTWVPLLGGGPKLPLPAGGTWLLLPVEGGTRLLPLFEGGPGDEVPSSLPLGLTGRKGRESLPIPSGLPLGLPGRSGRERFPSPAAPPIVQRPPGPGDICLGATCGGCCIQAEVDAGTPALEEAGHGRAIGMHEPLGTGAGQTKVLGRGDGNGGVRATAGQV